MAVDSWVKPVSISAIVAASILSLSDERLSTVKTIYNNLVDYHIHGWAILGLLLFALYNQWLAIGATTRIENLKAAEDKLVETNNAVIKSIAGWEKLVTTSIKIGNSNSTQNAWTVLFWLAKDQKTLQEIADNYKEEIMKG